MANIWLNVHGRTEQTPKMAKRILFFKIPWPITISIFKISVKEFDFKDRFNGSFITLWQALLLITPFRSIYLYFQIFFIDPSFILLFVFDSTH